jgi:hypothetical protein
VHAVLHEAKLSGNREKTTNQERNFKGKGKGEGNGDRNGKDDEKGKGGWKGREDTGKGKEKKGKDQNGKKKRKQKIEKNLSPIFADGKPFKKTMRRHLERGNCRNGVHCTWTHGEQDMDEIYRKRHGGWY